MTRHSREQALSDREFERLLQAVEQIDENWNRTATRFVVLVAGRLGLQAGEIAHIQEDWVDFRDGEQCGYCRSLAKNVVEHGVPSIAEARLRLY